MKRCPATNCYTHQCSFMAGHAGPHGFTSKAADDYYTCVNCGEGANAHTVLDDKEVHCLFAPTLFQSLKGYGSKS